MDKPFLKSKKAIMTLIGVLFASGFIAVCYMKPELMALQSFASAVIFSIIGHGAIQGWVESKQPLSPSITKTEGKP